MRTPLLFLAVSFGVPILLALSGCTKPSATSDAPVATCTHAEQKCQYASGKLGLCTPSGMECDGSASCLVCMSLH